MSKYHNLATKYRGVKYHSKKEAEYAMYLDSEKLKGKIKDWESQHTIKLMINNQLVCKYISDFKIINNDLSEEFIEVKGVWTSTAKLKFKLLKILYPNIKITVV